MEEMLIEVLKRLERLETMISGRTPARGELLTTKDAAAYIGSTPGALRKLAQRRAIGHYKDRGGRTLRFKRSELDEWMKSTKVSTSQELISTAAVRLIRNNH